MDYIFFAVSSRSPYGERGLKSFHRSGKTRPAMSLPVWGAWIEIIFAVFSGAVAVVAPRMGSVD